MAGQDIEPITRDELRQPLFRLLPVVAMLAVMWAVEIVDVPLDGDLDRFGIRPRRIDGLDGIVFGPFLHRGFGHLFANSIPFVLLGAAEASGAPLAITGNLYVYGPVDRPMTEDMPLAAPTVKGQVRVKMWQDAVAAYRSGRISGVTEVRGSDYLSPRYSVIEMAMPGLRANKTVWLPGPLDHPHTFTYTGDMAAALIALARDPRAWGQAWHVPSPAPMSMREVVAKVAEVGGFPLPRLRSLPEGGGPSRWALRPPHAGVRRDELSVGASLRARQPR